MTLSEGKPCPDHPERYEAWPQLRCRIGLTGRCYWEAEWEREVNIAVTYKETENYDSVFGANEHSWSLYCREDSYYALHNKTMRNIHPLPTSSSNRVGVYLDWPAGTLSFYRVSSDPPIHLHTFYTTFTDSVCPGFGFFEGSDSSASLCQL